MRGGIRRREYNEIIIILRMHLRGTLRTFAQHNTVFELMCPDTVVKGADNTPETLAKCGSGCRIFHLGVEIYCQRRSIPGLLESLVGAFAVIFISHA